MADLLRELARIASAEDGKTTGDGTGVGLFIRIPAAFADKFPSKEEDKSPPHVTFLYIGKCPPGRENEMVEAIERATKRFGPFHCTLVGYDEFKNPEGQRIPHVEIGFNRDIPNLRKAVWRELMDGGFQVDDRFPDYKPHSTLGYLDGEEKYKGPVPKGEFDVNEIEVWGLPRKRTVSLGRLKAAAVDDICTVFTSCPTQAARSLATILVKERLAASANVVEGTFGVYWFEGALKEGPESLLLLRTAWSVAPYLVRRIKEIHPYHLPEISVYAIDSNLSDTDFARWVKGEMVKSAASAPLLRTRGQVRDAMVLGSVGEYKQSESVSAAVALASEGRVLVVRRASTAPWMPGAWTLVTGGVEQNENPRTAAVREAREELGVDVSIRDRLGVGRAPGEGVVFFYYSDAYRGTIRLNPENDLYRWASADELKRLPMPDLHRRFAWEALGGPR